MSDKNNNHNDFKDTLSNVTSDGKRIWIFPKKPKGWYYRQRKYVSYLLLLLLYGLPFIKYNDAPLILFNVFERKFIILGQIFAPQDFYIFALSMITIVVIIVLFTVVFGRIFCGWVCPQTIFMEMVYRRIEYLIEGDYKAQKKLNKQEWDGEKTTKKTVKHIIFILIATITVHTFVAYIIGIDETLRYINSNPLNNISGFIAVFIVTMLFYGVFAFFREQACTAVCPYGRFQGVLLDKQSIVVAYDHVRGEPRGYRHKNQNNDDLGDCIDCHQCVDVCPTGIDIRNGTQLECVNCTACIDACDDIMTKISKPKGLIRYTSEESIEKKTPFRFTSRMKAYTIVLILLSSVLVALTFTRSDTSMTITRVSGQTYQKRDNNKISNLYRLVVNSKTLKNTIIELQMAPPSAGVIEIIENENTLNKEGYLEAILFIVRDRDAIKERRERMHIKVIHDNKVLAESDLSFLSPRIY